MASSRSELSVDLIHRLQEVTRGHPFWEQYLTGLSSNTASFAVHLAVLVEPYLRFVLEGRKTIESRFSSKRIAPFNSVTKGDVVLLKRSSGPIVGICQLQSCWFYHLDASSWSEIRGRYTKALCAEDPSFWETRRSAAYATLMRIRNVQEFPAIEYRQRNRRGWIVLQPRVLQTELPESALAIEKRSASGGY